MLLWHNHIFLWRKKICMLQHSCDTRIYSCGTQVYSCGTRPNCCGTGKCPCIFLWHKHIFSWHKNIYSIGKLFCHQRDAHELSVADLFVLNKKTTTTTILPPQRPLFESSRTYSRYAYRDVCPSVTVRQGWVRFWWFCLRFGWQDVIYHLRHFFFICRVRCGELDLA